MATGAVPSPAGVAAPVPVPTHLAPHQDDHAAPASSGLPSNFSSPFGPTASSANSSTQQHPASSQPGHEGTNGTTDARDMTATPRIITEHDMNRVVKALEIMRQQGIDHYDPKFQKLLHIYRSHSHLFGQSTSSSSPAARTTPEVPPSKAPANTVSLISSKASPNGPFTMEQLQQLRAQILAYKYLSRNMALPAALLAAVRNPSSAKREPGSDLTAQEDRLRRIQSAAPGSGGTKVNASGLYVNKSRLVLAGAGQTPSAQVAPAVSKKEALIAQISSPAHLTAKQLTLDREKRMAARIDARLEELRQLLTQTQLPEELRVRALIEEKQLKLLVVQKRLRHRIATELRYEMQLACADDPTLFRRSSKRHAKQTVSKSERQKEREEQRKQHRQKEFCAAVVAHAKAFRDFHGGMQQKWKRVSRAVVTYHTNLQKRKQAIEEKNERDRLRALKDNNIEEYMRLLNETKSARVQLLLEQTEKYLKSIEALVAKHQQDEIEEERREKEAAAHEPAEESESAEKDKEKDIEGSAEQTTTLVGSHKETELESSGAAKVVKKTYYTMVHRVEEEITRQPEMLVGGQLKPYQIIGLNWLVSLYNNHLNGILADEMGLGKTIQTISLLCYLMETKGNNGPYLIVVPLSTLSNWVNEFDKWAPSVVRVVYKGAPVPRKHIYQTQIAHGKFNVVITTYDYIIKDKSSLGKIKWNYIIIDEGHRMKNHACKLVTTFSQNYKARHRLLLTGTPLQNSLPELWSLLNFLLPSIFNSIENFEEWFNAPFAASGEKVEINEEESLLIINRLHKVLRPFLLRRLKKQVEDQLPDKVEKVLKCGFSAWQKRMYKHMREQKVVRLEGSEDGKGGGFRGLMNTLMQLRKICNHPYLFNDTGDYDLDDNLVRSAGKFELLDRIFPKLKATGHRVLLFSQMTSLLTVLENYFRLREYNYLRLDGTTKADERAELLKLFNAPDSPYFVFILSTRAGGLGLNLQTADTVVLFDSDWNPHADLQAQDRAHRIGQKHEVRVFRLVTVNSIEERILARAHYKLGLDKKIIEAGMFNKKSNAKERKSMLEEIMRQEEEAKDLEEEDIPNDKQINEMLARTRDEFDLFQKMDKERAERERAETRRLGLKETPSRLMTDEELPDWLRVDHINIEEDPTIYGRGHRRKAAPVSYDDGLTEGQWEKLLEGGGDEQGIAEMREKNLSRKAKRMAESLGGYGEEAEQPPRKRNRRDREVAPPPPPRAREKKNSRKASVNQAKMKRIWEAIATSREPETGRQRSQLFMRLPSKKLYPDYFEIIKKPVSLTNIKTNIEKSTYNQHLFKEEFNLMFENAQQYNIPDSEVYQDAVFLQKLFYVHWEQNFGPNAQADENPDDDENKHGADGGEKAEAAVDTQEQEPLSRRNKRKSSGRSKEKAAKGKRSRDSKDKSGKRKQRRKSEGGDPFEDGSEGHTMAVFGEQAEAYVTTDRDGKGNAAGKGTLTSETASHRLTIRLRGPTETKQDFDKDRYGDDEEEVLAVEEEVLDVEEEIIEEIIEEEDDDEEEDEYDADQVDLDFDD